MNKMNKRGFTLAELLIVVAIIAVLAAIAIPVFSAQLNRSKYQTDMANARSIYSELSADYLARSGKDQTGKVTMEYKKTDNSTGTVSLSTTATSFNDAGTYTLTIAGESTDYDFSGLSKVSIKLGNQSTKPEVKIEPYPDTKEYGDKKSFGTSVTAP